MRFFEFQYERLLHSHSGKCLTFPKGAAGVNYRAVFQKKVFALLSTKLFSSRLQVNYLQRILAQRQAKGKL